MTCVASQKSSRAQWSAKPQAQQGRPCRLRCLADRRCACRLPSKKNPSLAGLSGQAPKSFFRWATLRKRGQSRLRLGKDVPDRAAGKDCRKCHGSYRRFRCERSGLRGWIARNWKGCAHGSLDRAFALGRCRTAQAASRTRDRWQVRVSAGSLWIPDVFRRALGVDVEPGQSLVVALEKPESPLADLVDLLEITPKPNFFTAS